MIFESAIPFHSASLLPNLGFMKKLILIPLILFIPFFSFALGIMASDLTWYCIGKDSFMIKLTLYTDCNQEKPGDAQVNIYCKQDHSLLNTLCFPRPQGIDITPTCNEPCTRCSNPSCTYPYGIERYEYRKLLVFDGSASCCEILLSYSQCCRSAALSTVKDPGNSNFYTYAVLNRCTDPCDNSPDFSNIPVAILCQCQEFVYCHGEQNWDIEPGGGLLDSLAYKIASPLISEDTALEFNYPYSYDKPVYFKGFPDANAPNPMGMHTDLCNISFTPMVLQQTVMNIKVSEFRKGTKIGEVLRNMYFIIIPCPPNNNPVFMTDTFYKEIFTGETVKFTIPSFDADPEDTVTISWNHGIPGALWTDNNGQVKYPTGILTWTPDNNRASTIAYSFTVQLKDDHNRYSGRSSRTFQVLVKKTVGIRKLNPRLDFRITPNPGDGQFKVIIDNKTTGRLTVHIYDISGKEVFCETKDEIFPQLEYPLDLHLLENGIYFIKIINRDKQGTEKLIINR